RSTTYDHRILRTGLPVRSALLKQDTGGLVVRWVTTGESPLLYVLAIFLAPIYPLISILLRTTLQHSIPWSFPRTRHADPATHVSACGVFDSFASSQHPGHDLPHD
ncbi:hypothetical protein EK21DRAFT_64671, partial [Setomelanomma holmii]